MSTALCKGLRRSHLEWQFGVRFTPDGGFTVPYYDTSGGLYREKEFSTKGKATRWLGEAKAQIPYGLETLKFGGQVAVLTEGESDSWWLRVNFPRTPVLGIPGASSWQSEWRSLVDAFPVIYFSFDADDAGTTLLNTVWPDLPWGRRVKLAAGRDTRDVLELEGVEAYERFLADADYIAACTRYILESPARLGGSCVAA